MCRSLLYLPVILFALEACAPVRPPVPPGEVPRPKALSVTDEEYGHQVLTGLTERFPLDYSDSRLATVQDVVDRLTQAAGAGQDPWHVYLFKDDSYKNAAATRGNHIFIWSGLLNEVQSDDELAAILGHEISHVLARHTDPDPNEELKKLLIGVGAMAASIAVGQAIKTPMVGSNLGDLAGSVTKGVGEGVLVNPYSRDLEYEADQIGLFLMADAGFDPEGAISFWRRVQGDPDFSTSVAFLSSHPPAADRLARLEKLLPQAIERYSAHRTKITDRDAQTVTAHPDDRKRDPAGFSRTPATEIPSLVPSFPDDHSTADYIRVVEPHTVLFDRRSKRSAALGEFRPGSIIRVVGRSKGWYEIDRPDHGFIEERNVERMVSPHGYP